MLDHLLRNWGRRHYDDTNRVLQRFMWIAEAARGQNKLGLLEDAARTLFRGEARWERFAQRTRTQRWLERLNDEPAEAAARALRAVPKACAWYLGDRWRPVGAHPAIKAALSEGAARDRERRGS
jgi:hypothetical protein